MKTVYNLLTKASTPILELMGMVNPKLKAFVKGRKPVFEQLRKQIQKNEKYLWMHCASLGEYEQGLPVLEAFRSKYPNYKVLLTFFSPSGYEVRKNSPLADVVTYLPLDTKENAKKFISLVNPSLSIFVKYEFWPNYLDTLKQNQIPTLLVSGVFRSDQALFKSYGGFLKKSLEAITHFFVQNQSSLAMLKKHGFENLTLSGDTRFDRVSRQIEMDNNLDFMTAFVGDSDCFVFGSTWPEDEDVIVDFVNKHASKDLKIVIAPHEIGPKKIENLEHKLTAKMVRFSQYNNTDLGSKEVMIIDTIGLLTKIYSYGHMAYVGGAMGTSGLHNILEPATFGLPIIIGKNFSKFPEAQKLRELAGLYSVSSAQEFEQIASKMLTNVKFRTQTGMIAGHFVNSNTGATKKILSFIEGLDRDGLI